MNVSFSGSNYALTTRTLEDDADLGEFQHTTGPSVIVTSPLSQQSRAPPSLNQLNSGLPTVFPTQAQIGFGEPLKNSSSSGRNFTINKAVSDESKFRLTKRLQFFSHRKYVCNGGTSSKTLISFIFRSGIWHFLHSKMLSVGETSNFLKSSVVLHRVSQFRNQITS